MRDCAARIFIYLHAKTTVDQLEILSVSIDDETLGQLKEIQKKLGFKSRSKLLRIAIQGIMKDYQELDSHSGSIECVFMVMYDEEEKNHVSDIIHRFKKMINTEVHHHSFGRELEILIMRGDAKEVGRFFTTVKKSKCIYSVNYSIIKKE